VLGILLKLVRHLFNRQQMVDKTAGDGAPNYRIVLGRFEPLSHGHAAEFLDGFEA